MFKNFTLGLAALSIFAMPLTVEAQGHDGKQNGHSNSRGNDNRGNGKHDNGLRGNDKHYSGQRGNDHRSSDYRAKSWNNANANRNVRYQSNGWKSYRKYDYNRPPRGQNAYYADRYYRDGRYYQTRRLGPNDRIYRGSNNRYYCRRNDGTTGLVIGAIGGGILGNTIASGGSQTLGTLLGGGLGAVLGRSIDRNNVSCR